MLIGVAAESETAVCERALLIDSSNYGHIAVVTTKEEAWDTRVRG